MTAAVDVPSGYVTAAEYARMRGVSKQAASKWPLVRVEDPRRPGKYLVDVAATDAKRAVEQNPLKRMAPTAPAQGEALAASIAPAALSPALDADRAQARSSRAEKEHWSALNERLGYGERVGALVSRAQVERAQAEIMRSLRTNMMAVGALVAPKVADESDPRAVRALIDAAVRRALSGASVDIDKLAEAEDAAAETETAPDGAPTMEDADA
ncbi:hypothetical protein ACFQ4O_01760 [Methylopila musalis]|uniref:Terminase small subunit n=1 Tax=Methylopila musalis TaxID=1134781 RepID=A0ABW3Z380_9HYPH